ncbi:MAG: DUF262 domain-containing protein [Magnetococcales bacterium]|nr:DUF262 domain-containing protein [Magnetococcales bacterium]
MKQQKVRKEYYENEDTGVEEESSSILDQDLTKPYDPNKIRVDSKPYSIRQILDMIDQGEMDIAPDFQRRRVWQKDQQSLLIESILLRIPLPVFYCSADGEGLLQVVDGVQRLSTIRSFRKNEFALDRLEYLQHELQGKYFSELEKSLWSRRFMSTTLAVNVIDPQTPDQVKFDIFRRLNTGGTPLNPQEIRHCISKPRTREFLAKLCSHETFHKVTRSKLKDHVRMVDREVVLRHCAFRGLENISDYSHMNGIDDLLTRTVHDLGNPSKVPDRRLDELERGFSFAMEQALQLFGEDHAFRKWYTHSDEIHPFNRALFDVWSVMLTRVNATWLKKHTAQVVKDARRLMTDDDNFISAITSGTGKYSQIQERFTKVQKLLQAGLS